MSRFAHTYGEDKHLGRENELDALAGIIPIDRRETLAALLTDQDVATLRHLAEKGMGRNTLRALASDLGYLEAWALAATGERLPWPAPEGLALRFLAHHLWDPVKRETELSHGMPEAVAERLKAEGFLRADGPHAPGTIRRRLASWTTLHRWRGFDPTFATPAFKTALRLSVRASARPPQRKSQQAVTRQVLHQLLSTCVLNRLMDRRDCALLLTAIASGGRRRSEIASLRIDQIETLPPVAARPREIDSPKLPCLAIYLGRTKRGNADDGVRVLLIGRPAEALTIWLNRAKIIDGAVFRSIDRQGRLGKRAISGDTVNDIVKRRCKMAGLDPTQFSAHGLRSGYMTQAARDGVSLPEAMQQSQHRSVQQAARYYNDVEQQLGRAARLYWR
ncbi:tyrosine-type recombinase/integrase [Microvirga lotononidis]|uniref:Site-specific recombinase XerD n=1 Tax=Microvirga lotononidis TaxID=864069 RepID=I4YVL0_9HYPH|nr:tyrosine-type recombinase/integrase [Microvirga lotononidis]EIM28002.1 site-specific recombinase XerD [Microvirga lotononidis]WQO27880.1 tyrosine-type recombinase/integrase [Microvirga lotononidis]